MPTLRENATGRDILVQQTPRLVAGIWECGDQRFTDETGTQYSTVDDFPVVGPIAFFLLFYPQELVAIDSARVQDALIRVFWRILEDTRTVEVDFRLPLVRGLVMYLANAGYIENSRVTEIIAGKIPD